MSRDILNSGSSSTGHDTDSLSIGSVKKEWVKPELQKIDSGSDTEAAKPNNTTFESSPGWGIS